jgi:osmotically-inducible protein OsmY
MNAKEVIRHLRAKLERDPRINFHRHPVTIATQDSDLILAGEVQSVAVKKLILLAASETDGVQRIVDRLKVAPAEKMGDAEIRDHVCRVLTEEPALERCVVRGGAAATLQAVRTPEPPNSILVEVNEGVVTLNGQVPSLTHKRLAGVLAWWVPGSRDVINGLEEVPPEADNDDELVDAVRLVLEKDPLVNASEIRVTAQNWIVTLDGLVASETMRQAAERDTWCVLGVKDVINATVVKR